ncbi:hypothetical protein [Marinoscillum sp.]|uniref:hypothetical protein n=1 Tax=Marinoscillum sp. TaxID=2024838 RepID=UPI003BAA09C7
MKARSLSFLLTFTLLTPLSLVAQVSANHAWKKDINESTPNLKNLYTPNAVRITPELELVTGVSAIAKSWLAKDLTISEIQTKQVIQANPIYDYEIGTFTTSDGLSFSHLIIWKNVNATKKREFELVYERTDQQPDIKVLDPIRELWMKYANQHEPMKLVQATYHENAYYYNHRPMIIGVAAIGETYAYMKRESYELHLSPIIVEPVNENIIYEIGQCSGSYGGNYILVWKRGAGGEWKIMLDSNI